MNLKPDAMKKRSISFFNKSMLLTAVILTSCSENIPAQQVSSASAEKRTSKIDWIDSTNNAYSNFMHGIGMKLPRHWSFDRGMSQHTLFRGMEADSGISFTLNVIPVEEEFQDIQIDKPEDLYAIYLEAPQDFEKMIRESVELQLNSKIKTISIQKSYLKNRVCLKTYVTYDMRDFDFEYENTMILYQTATYSRMYNIGLTLPTMIYLSSKSYYEDVFDQVFFISGDYNSSK